jgi:formate hydrogenlyase subunit 3/multisubunit Na+/H+ antiporter MnhD subunit
VLVLLPIFLLLLAALAISLLGLFRPKFSYHWLIAAGGALLTYVIIWVSRGQLPVAQSIGGGEVSILMLPAFSLQMDEVTWPFALAVVTLCLAVLMTDVGRAAETSWMVWAGDLGLTALGLIAVLAENPMTLLIGWSLVDVIELGILLRQVRRPATRQRVLLFFIASVLGSMSVLGAVVAAGSLGMDLGFGTIPPQAQIFLVLAAGLRMGVFPLQVAFLSEVQHQRGQGTLLRLLPPATSMPLLVYAAFTPVSPAWRYILLAFSVLAALYGGVAWARARDELRGRIYWIISMAGLMFFATLQFRPEAALAWGLAMLFGGAALFLASVRTKWMVSLGIISFLTISGLPFMPTYPGLGMYSPLNLVVLGVPFAHAALLLGYLRHAWRQTEPLRGVERWVQVVYPIGLTLLPVTYILSTVFSPGIPGAVTPPFWPILVLLGITLVMGLLYLKKVSMPMRFLNQLDRIFSLRWLYSLLGWVYQGVGRVGREISLLLEGEGGVLWALVLLVLLVSILSQLAAGTEAL